MRFELYTNATNWLLSSCNSRYFIKTQFCSNCRVDYLQTNTLSKDCSFYFRQASSTTDSLCAFKQRIRHIDLKPKRMTKRRHLAPMKTFMHSEHMSRSSVRWDSSFVLLFTSWRFKETPPSACQIFRHRFLSKLRRGRKSMPLWFNIKKICKIAVAAYPKFYLETIEKLLVVNNIMATSISAT